jgi:class 3 adenylate cyclase
VVTNVAAVRTRGELLSRTAATATAIALATPVVGLVVLLSAPSVDPHWDHQPSHFWLVLGAAAIAAALGWSIGRSATKRADGRLFLVSMSFIASALFLGLHALATPRVLLDGSNAGFVVAVPVGLVISAALAAWSAIPLDGPRARWIVAHTAALQLVLTSVVAAWAIASLAELAPLDDPTPVESGSAFMIVLGLPAAAAFAFAAWRYLVLARQRRARLLVAVAAAWVLLGEAAVAVSITDSWRVSWWTWHVLMLVAFGAIATAAARLPDDERFSDLYLDEVAGGTRDVSVLFADLKGFTQFSEHHPPETVREMLNTYLEAVLPRVRDAGGRLDRIIGDAVMVTFNVSTDQPDHADRAARAALALQEAAARVSARHPDWPRFRAGVNTGAAVVGVLGDDTQRDYTVLGDTVNVASHIESLAPVGAVAISDATRRAVAGAQVVSLGTVTLKTRAEPIEIWRLDGLNG